MRAASVTPSITPPPLILCIAPVPILLLLAVLTLGCSGPPTESAFAHEFQRLHGTTDPGMLTEVEISPEAIVAAIRPDLRELLPILLPGYLPPGFGLAAPFRGTGSGSPLPNPQVWVDGYAVTYTEGQTRITVVVGQGDELAVGWGEKSPATFRGRSLFVRDGGDLVQVSTGPDDGMPVVVVGERLELAEVLRVAAGLRLVDGPRE